MKPGGDIKVMYKVYSATKDFNYSEGIINTSCGNFQKNPTNGITFYPYHHLECRFIICWSNNASF